MHAAILHNWDDEKSMRILRRCKDAITRPGGKVIVVDMVKKKWADPVTNEVQLSLDLHMMVLHNGKERTEEEWKKLFTETGFSRYRIVANVGLQSLIEVFP
ncbi:unnamed protein product [Victoria cruziana]